MNIYINNLKLIYNNNNNNNNNKSTSTKILSVFNFFQFNIIIMLNFILIIKINIII